MFGIVRYGSTRDRRGFGEAQGGGGAFPIASASGSRRPATIRVPPIRRRGAAYSATTSRGATARTVTTSAVQVPPPQASARSHTTPSVS